VRVWIPACATGEEAYSIAMLPLEYADTLEASPGLQIFGSDLDESAVQIARSEKYPEAIAADVSEERLRRFFVREAGGFQIRREVREIVLFATQNLGFGEWRTGPFDIDHLLESTDPRAL
jgi:two-component system, chemotaxis family, CheB/CheR fusion protein